MTQQEIKISLTKEFDMDYHIDQKFSIWEPLYVVMEWTNPAGYIKYPLIALPAKIFTKEQITRLIQTGAFSYENYMKYALRRMDNLVSCGSYSSRDDASDEVHTESFKWVSGFYTKFGREVVEATKWFSELINLDIELNCFVTFEGLKRYCFYQLMRAIKYNDDRMIEEFYREFNM